MTDSLIPFEYSGRTVRTVLVDGEPWFVAADVCAVLDLEDVRRAVERVDEDDRSQTPVVDAAGRWNPKTWVVSESGLYDLIVRSDKPEARPFRRWITAEVLPAIRKTGRYSVAELTRSDLARMIIDSEQELAATRARVDELAPKAELAETYLIATGGTRLVREAAKLLGMRERDLRAFLLAEKMVFVKHAACGDVMYDHYAEHAHHFAAHETVVNHTWGSCAHYTLRITPRGIDLIRKRLAAPVPSLGR